MPQQFAGRILLLLLASNAQLLLLSAVSSRANSWQSTSRSVQITGFYPPGMCISPLLVGRPGRESAHAPSRSGCPTSGSHCTPQRSSLSNLQSGARLIVARLGSSPACPFAVSFWVFVSFCFVSCLFGARVFFSFVFCGLVWSLLN